MRTSGPTARPAHATRKLRDCFIDADISRLCLLARNDPADPFVLGERRDVIPYHLGFGMSGDSFGQVGGQCMRQLGGRVFLGHVFLGHTCII